MGYATLSDLSSCGLPAAALASIASDVKQAALDDASALADSYIGDKYQLPLGTPYDRSLVRMVCYIAAWDLLSLRGYNPSDPTDAVVSHRADIARDWFIRVANGQARLSVSQGTPESFQPDVYTNPDRGWGDLGMGGTDDPFTISGG